MNYPQNRIFTYALLTAVIALLCIVLFRGCNEPEPQTNPLKAEVAALKQTKSAIHDTVIYRDSIRTITVTKWRTVRHDSLIPCETKLIICDTVIRADSALIAALRSEVLISDLIISKQDTIIRTDSTTIAHLTRKVRRQKFWLKVVSITAVGCLGAAVVR